MDVFLYFVSLYLVMETETQDKPESENKNDINSKKEEIISKVREIDKWEEIGAHRPLGQLWYTVGYSLIAIVLSVVFLVGFISWIFPFPEIRGYFKIADQFFLLVFQVFDMGTAYSIDRFIGEWRVKDEKKMIKYVQFFFW